MGPLTLVLDLAETSAICTLWLPLVLTLLVLVIHMMLVYIRRDALQTTNCMYGLSDVPFRQTHALKQVKR